MIDEEAMCNGKLWLTAVQNGTNGKTASIKWYFSIFLIFHFSSALLYICHVVLTVLLG